MMPVAPAYSGDLSSWLPPLDLVVAGPTRSGISIYAPGCMRGFADFRSVIYPSQSPRSVSLSDLFSTTYEVRLFDATTHHCSSRTRR